MKQDGVLPRPNLISSVSFPALSEHPDLLFQPCQHLLRQPGGLRTQLQEQHHLIPHVVEVFVLKLQIIHAIFGHG